MIRIGTVLALSGVALFAGFIMPTDASAQGCSQWDVVGHWDIVQSNTFWVRMDLAQDYPTGEIYGNASYYSKGSGTVEGTVHGWIRGDVVELNTSWGGIYTGSVTTYRFLEGYTHAKNSPQINVAWRSDYRKVACRDVAALPPAPAEAGNPLDRFGAVQQPRGGGADVLTKMTPPPAQPAPPAGQTAITKNDVDIYQGPDGSYAVLGWVEATAQAAVLAHQNDWYQLDFNGVPGVHWKKPGQTKGWISYDHLAVKP